MGITIKRCTWVMLGACGVLVPATARADGIDLPIALGLGVGVLVPLLLFNATVEAPVVARYLGLNFADLWWPWCKANGWSLLAGIPVLLMNGLLKQWLVPAELGARIWVQPWFLVLAITVYYAVTVLVEFVYARGLLRQEERAVAPGRVLRAVIAGNAVSYLVLAPVFLYREFPRSEVIEFAADTRWARQPSLAVLAVGRSGQLEAARADGANPRVVVPHEVRDYVVSADLNQVLYRGVDDRYFLFHHGTNSPIPDLGLRCRASEMDFSPDGRHAAFIGRAQGRVVLRVFDAVTRSLRDVPHLGVEVGYDDTVAWSARANAFYLRFGKEYWEICLNQEVGYTKLGEAPEDLADHYGRMGTTWNRDGAFYQHHKLGQMELFAHPGFSSRLRITGPQREHLLTIRDPAGEFWVEQTIFLEGGHEVLVGLGGYVYLADVASKRLGPVLQGSRFIALTGAFSKRVDFPHR